MILISLSLEFFSNIFSYLKLVKMSGVMVAKLLEHFDWLNFGVTNKGACSKRFSKTSVIDFAKPGPNIINNKA